MHSQTTNTGAKVSSWLLSGLLLIAALSLLAEQAEAGQGCPFDDGSCREYCNQQGCNMGYCGHFAWIQCICRKCGDEWSWYDKVRYNPNKMVNQTELDSLELNRTAPLILTNSSEQQQYKPKPIAPESNKQQQTLTTLLIPDLSDTSGKLDLNDIPDENSDKFLDYLAKNHEKLVQATTARESNQQTVVSSNNKAAANGGLDLEPEGDQEEDLEAQTSSSDETIEIQISTSNNNNAMTPTSPQTPIPTSTNILPKQLASTSTSQTTSSQTTASSAASAAAQSQKSPVTRLLKMSAVERASEEIN